MATLSNNNIAEAIYLGARDKSQSDQADFYKQVVQFLVRKKLFSRASEILLILNKIINKHEGRIQARVSSAKALDENTKRELRGMLTKRYSAKSVELVENLDERLIGGFRLEIDDEVIDLTIKNKIKQLQEHLA